jgi:hypothetical protein
MSARRPALAENLEAPERDKPATYVAPSRKGKKLVNFATTAELHHQLKGIAHSRGVSLQGLMLELVNELMEREKRKPIA